jgi:DNA/RNA-binding domain of Phe-tRNA-synthetase-like protein
MFIHDELGVLSSIIYGPDQRTRLGPTTQRVLFTVYAPPGIPEERVRRHLADLKDLVLAVSPGAKIDHSEVVLAAS